MKKVFRNIALCLAFSTMGLTTTSCGDDELVSAIIQELITNLIGQQGQVYQYNAKGSVQKLYKQSAEGSYVNGAAPVSFTALLPVTVSNNTASITIPAMNVDGMSMSNVTISGLGLTAVGNQYTSMLLSEGSTGVDGTVTVNGTQYPVTSLFIKDARLTSEQMSMETFQIFFGENLEYVVSLTNVTGEIVSNQ